MDHDPPLRFATVDRRVHGTAPQPRVTRPSNTPLLVIGNGDYRRDITGDEIDAAARTVSGYVWAMALSGMFFLGVAFGLWLNLAGLQ